MPKGVYFVSQIFSEQSNQITYFCYKFQVLNHLEIIKMITNKYSQSVENLSKAIDIAISVLQEYPPKNWNNDIVDNVINTYLGFKNDAENPKPQFRNSQSLKYVTDNVFTYFQEETGKAVNSLWNKIKEHKLPYKRENKLVKILKRKRINSQIEYDFVIDVIVPYQQERLINEDDIVLLNTLINKYLLNTCKK